MNYNSLRNILLYVRQSQLSRSFWKYLPLKSVPVQFNGMGYIAANIRPMRKKIHKLVILTPYRVVLLQQGAVVTILGGSYFLLVLIIGITFSI